MNPRRLTYRPRGGLGLVRSVVVREVGLVLFPQGNCFCCLLPDFRAFVGQYVDMLDRDVQGNCWVCGNFSPILHYVAVSSKWMKTVGPLRAQRAIF